MTGVLNRNGEGKNDDADKVIEKYKKVSSLF